MDSEDDGGHELQHSPEAYALQLAAGGPRNKWTRVAAAALGSLPWVGAAINAASTLAAEEAQGRVNALHVTWMEEHRAKLETLTKCLAEMTTRLDQLGDDVDARVNGDEYLGLVRYGFRVWDKAATNEKRRLVQQLLTNAGATSISSDDVVRLFIEWVERYHEAHFAVIREVYRHKGITRGGIWDALHSHRPADNSPEADLFRLLVHDLSTGRVLRQHRPTNYAGQFIKKERPRRSSRGSSTTMKSAFDDEEPYELTALGEQFVHYAMNEVVPRFGS